MIDILPFAGMIFSLLLVLIIGGFILLFPLSRRLGQLLEIRMEERRQSLAAGGAPAELAKQLETTLAALESLRGEVASLSARQQFVERLLEAGEEE